MQGCDVRPLPLHGPRIREAQNLPLVRLPFILVYPLYVSCPRCRTVVKLPVESTITSDEQP